jgi:ATP-dependent Clp protease ATP-binding subunit ClpB
MPAEIDEIQRRITQLEIEREALKKEKDQASGIGWRKIEERSRGAEGRYQPDEGPMAE